MERLKEAETDPDFQLWYIGAWRDRQAHKTEGKERDRARRSGHRPVDDPDPKAYQPVPIVSEGGD